jgi:hypothetical protein
MAEQEKARPATAAGAVKAPAPAAPEPAPTPVSRPVLGRASESGDAQVHWLLARREAAAAAGSGLDEQVPLIDAELAGYGVGV